MKNRYLTWLMAALLLPGAAQAQCTGAQPVADGQALPPAPALETGEVASARAVLGGPPPAPSTVPAATPALDLLRQLPLAAPAGAPQLSAEEVAQVFPQGVRRPPGFLPAVSALATATALAGSRSLLVLALPPSAAGVPAGGATPGQQLRLLSAAGELTTTVAQPAAAGSHRLVVHAVPGLAGQPVFVVGLEPSASLAIDYEALARLNLAATQQLAQQLAAMQAQLASLHDQLTAARQLNSALLLDHAALQDLKQQVSLLLSQQAATFSATRQRRGTSWLAD